MSAECLSRKENLMNFRSFNYLYYLLLANLLIITLNKQNIIYAKTSNNFIAIISLLRKKSSVFSIFQFRTLATSINKPFLSNKQNKDLHKYLILIFNNHPKIIITKI